MIRISFGLKFTFISLAALLLISFLYFIAKVELERPITMDIFNAAVADASTSDPQTNRLNGLEDPWSLLQISFDTTTGTTSPDAVIRDSSDHRHEGTLLSGGIVSSDTQRHGPYSSKYLSIISSIDPAVRFDGSRTMLQRPIYGKKGNVCFAAWIKPSAAAMKGYKIILQKSQSFIFGLDAGYPRLYIPGTGLSPDPEYINSKLRLDSEKWNYVAVCLTTLPNKTTVGYYRADNKQLSQRDNTIPTDWYETKNWPNVTLPASFDNDLFLGGSADVDGINVKGFTGQLDDLFIQKGSDPTDLISTETFNGCEDLSNKTYGCKLISVLTETPEHPEWGKVTNRVRVMWRKDSISSERPLLVHIPGGGMCSNQFIQEEKAYSLMDRNFVVASIIPACENSIRYGILPEAKLTEKVVRSLMNDTFIRSTFHLNHGEYYASGSSHGAAIVTAMHFRLSTSDGAIPPTRTFAESVALFPDWLYHNGADYSIWASANASRENRDFLDATIGNYTAPHDHTGPYEPLLNNLASIPHDDTWPNTPGREWAYSSGSSYDYFDGTKTITGSCYGSKSNYFEIDRGMERSLEEAKRISDSQIGESNGAFLRFDDNENYPCEHGLPFEKSKSDPSMGKQWACVIRFFDDGIAYFNADGNKRTTNGLINWRQCSL